MNKPLFKKIVFLFGFFGLLLTAQGAMAAPPTITRVAPTSTTIGTPVIITVDGTNFISGVSKIKFNGSLKTTTFISATKLSASLSAADVASAGTFLVKVNNSGVDSTASVNFTVIAGTIRFVKNTLGSPVGTFSFITGGFLLNQNPLTTAALTPKTGQASQEIDVIPGNGLYSILENRVPDGWAFTTANCKFPNGSSAGTPVGLSVINISVNANQITTCTFTNTYGATINLVKKTNGVSGTFNFDDNFNETIPSLNPTGPNAYNASFAITGITPSTGNSITEATPLPNGFALTSASCTNGKGTYNASTRSITGINLAVGDNITCTFNNTYTPPTGFIRVIKIVSDTTDNPGGDFYFTSAIPALNAYFGANVNPIHIVGSANNTNERTTGAIATGTYNLTESSMPKNYSLANASCLNNGATSPISAIVVGDGQMTTCTFTNNYTAPPPTTLQIKKICNPANDAGKFNLRVDGNAQSANIGCGGQTNAIPFPLGKHVVSETQGASTNLSDYVSVIGGDCAANGDVNLNSGDVKVCTITNTKNPKLTISKVVVNTGCTSNCATKSTFAPYKAGTNTLSEGVTTSIAPGTYNITEIEDPRYIKSYSNTCAGGSINLSIGQNATCTITNTYDTTANYPKLTISKVVVNTGCTSNCATKSTFAPYQAVSNTSSNTLSEGVATSIAPGTYNIIETEDSKYIKSYSNACAGGSIQMTSGTDKTCTITNTYKQSSGAPTLKLSKIVYNGGVGTKTSADWYLFANGSSGSFADAGNSSASHAVTADVAYTLSESNIPNYPKSSWACTGGGSLSGNIITLSAGENVTCTVTNTYVAPGSLKIIKVATKEAPSAVFDYDIVGTTSTVASIFTYGGNGSVGPTGLDLDVGTNYSVTETVPSGWTFASASCALESGTPTGSLTANGRSKVEIISGQMTTCTFTNTYPVATIVLVKNTIGGGGNFNYVLNKNGANTNKNIPQLNTNSANFFQDQTTITILNPGSGYSLAESLPTTPPGWSLTSASCTQGKGTFNSVTKSIDAIDLTVGDNITCTFTNTLSVPPKLTVKKVVIPSSNTGKFNLQIDSITVGTGANVSDGGTTGKIQTTAESHVVGETAGTSTSLDNYTKEISGDCDSSGHITLANGDDKTCTITNTYSVPATITLIKNATGGSGDFNYALKQNGADTNKNISTLSPNSANFFQDQTTVTGIAPGSNYSIEETLPPTPPGWSLTSADCVTSTGTKMGTFNASSKSITDIDLIAGDNLTCTFNNTFTKVPVPPKLTVKKILIPSSDAGRFNLQIDGVTHAFNVGDKGTTGAVTTSAGNHSVGETVVAGTDPNNYTYAFGGACSSGGNVTLAEGDDKTCTITNTKKSEPGPKPTPTKKKTNFNVEFIIPPDTSTPPGIIPPEN